MKSIAPACVAIVSALTVACGGDGAPARDTSTPPASAASPAPATSPAGRAPTSVARPRVVFLGDSLTAGYGLELKQSVPALTQEHLAREGYAYEVVNAGVSGDTSAGGLSRLDWSLDGNVAILVIELGANDGLRGLPVEALKRNLEEVITRAQQRNIKVLLTGMEAPPNYGPAYTASFRKVYRDLAREHDDVVFVPFYLDGVAGNPALNIADGIHPNPEGARIIERNLWTALQPLLQKDDR
jgi:acyl-CoA thioesterase-1